MTNSGTNTGLSGPELYNTPVNKLPISLLFYPWLTNVDMYLTWDCNYKCGHCMAGDVRREGSTYSDSRLLKETLDSLDGLKSVHFSGGEPFLHPDIFEILDYASRKVNEVRINTNGAIIPLNYEEAKEFFGRLPTNKHIYFSVDRYHEDQDPTLEKRVESLKKLSQELGFPVTFNIRIDNTGEVPLFSDETKQFIEKYSLGMYHHTRQPISDYNLIADRILKIGDARSLSARYIDLTKLLENTLKEPSIGILPDGTVVSDFLAAYIPKGNRPGICTLGNLNEDTLVRMLFRYQIWRKNISGKSENSALSSMIKDMGDYPFAVTELNNYDWGSPPLREIKEKTIANTARILKEILGKRMWRFDWYESPNPRHPQNEFQLVSDSGNIHFGMFIGDEKLDYERIFYHFTCQDPRYNMAKACGEPYEVRTDHEKGHCSIEHRIKIPEKKSAHRIGETLLLVRDIGGSHGTILDESLFYQLFTNGRCSSKEEFIKSMRGSDEEGLLEKLASALSGKT